MGFDHKRLLITAVLTLFSPAYSVYADSLSDIYKLALNNDAQFQRANAKLKSDEEQLNIIRASLLPNLNASGSSTYSKIESITGRPPNITTEPECFDENTQELLPVPGCVNQGTSRSNSHGWRVNLSQKVFDASAWFVWRQGQKMNERNMTDFAKQQQELIIRVAESYFNVLRQKDNLASIKAEEDAAQRQLDQAEQQFKVGLKAMTDVHDAQASYDAVKVRRIQAESDLINSFTEIEVLTNKPHSVVAELSADFPIRKPDGDIHDWVQKSMENNLDLKMARLDKDAARENLKAKKASHLPSLDAYIGYSDTDSGTNSSPSIRKGTTYQLSLSVPIYSGGRIISDRRKAYHDLNMSMSQETFQQRQTIQLTRQFYRNMVTEVQRIAARQQAIKSTESVLDATQVGYEVGTRQIVDVLNAQRSLFAAKRDYANSRYDYIMQSLRLKQMVGDLSPEDIYALNKWLIQKPIMISEQVD